MRTLLLDIETAPNCVYTWGYWDQNIASNQIVVSSYILCWSAKWHGSDEVMFSSMQKTTTRQMLGRMHKLLDRADAVVHYNGKKFDIRVLNREFVKYGFPPPSPYKQIDLLQIVRATFDFGINKMDHVARTLELGGKVAHGGFELWVDCMKNDRKAWKIMEEYNRGDVALLERLYKRLLPWINKHPSHGAHDDIHACPKCGSERFQQRGYASTATMKYKRYQCVGCGGWFRGSKTVTPRLKAGEQRYLNIAS